MAAKLNSKATPACEWLIIGGGPHGIAMAGALVEARICEPKNLVIVDAGPTPLWTWRQRAANCGMYKLRSDVNYHLDCWPVSASYTLAEWAESYNMQAETMLLDTQTQHLVATTRLFNAHCDWFMAQRQAKQAWRWQQGLVTSLVHNDRFKNWQVCLKDGQTLTAQHVVVATGQQQLNYPDWVEAIRPVYHLLDLHTPTTSLNWQALHHVTVIGEGLSSLNFALSMVQSGLPQPKVTLLINRPFKTSVLETDPATLAPEFLAHFSAVDYSTRRQLIQQSRITGSVPLLSLQALQASPVEIRQDLVKNAQMYPSSESVRLGLASGAILDTEAVVLGTGFAKGRCWDKLVQRLASDYDLALAEGDFPIPGADLQWLDGLYLLGGLAELELGPTSRNLAGAGQGVRRIMRSLLYPTTFATEFCYQFEPPARKDIA